MALNLLSTLSNQVGIDFGIYEIMKDELLLRTAWPQTLTSYR